MAKPSSTASDVPAAHEGVHYDNPSSKPLDVPVSKADRAGTQRLVWKAFLIVFLCIVAALVVMGLTRSP